MAQNYKLSKTSLELANGTENGTMSSEAAPEKITNDPPSEDEDDSDVEIEGKGVLYCIV